MKKWLVLLLLLLPVIFVAYGGVSATQVERDLYSRIDKGDVPGALALTTEDAVYDVPGCPEGGCKGKAAVKGAFERAVAEHHRHTIKSSKDSKNTAISQVEVELDLAKAAGVQRIVAKVTVELKGDKIARFQAQPDTTDPQTATVLNFSRLSGILRQHYDAVNKGDAAAAAALFTDDGVLVRAGCTLAIPCTGKVEIQKQVEREVGNKSRFSSLNVQVSGNTVTARVDFRNVLVGGAGIERAVAIETVTFTGDKISRYVQELDLSDPQTVVWANFLRLAGLATSRINLLQRGDVAGLTALFSDDAVFEGFGLCAPAPCVGKAAIQKEVQREVADKTRIIGVAGTARVSGNTVTRRVELRSDSIKAAGVERVVVSSTEEVREGKYSSVRFLLDASDPQTATYLKVAVLRQHYEAVNKGDVAATAAFFTADAVLVLGGCSSLAPCVGTAAIKLQLERIQIAQGRYSVISIQASGDTFTGRVELRNPNIKNVGLERVIENFTATFKGDKISRLAQELDPSDSQSAAFANFRRMVAILTRYGDPLSLGNVAGAMAALTEDAVFEGYGLCAAAPCSGKAAIQKEVEREVADKTKTTNIAGSDRVTGDTLNTRKEVRSDSIKAAGVERILVAITVEAKGDKASLIRWVPDPTDAQTATYLKSLAK